MSETSIFSKIIAQEIPAKLVYQDDLVTAFHDIHPQRPTHILIVPNKQIASMNQVTEADADYLARMLLVAPKIARELGIAEQGYRLIINCGQHGRQEVMHIHMHLLGGADCGPMLQKS